MGIFDKETKLFTTYETELVFRGKLAAGTPADPKIIEGWLRHKMGIDDKAELMAMMRRTLIELGVDSPEEATDEEVIEASKQMAADKHLQMFKRDEVLGLYIEARQVKSMLKENVNILFAGERWGKTKKGPKSFVAERVHIKPEGAIYLDRQEADDVETVTGVVSGPQGSRSIVGYYEYVREAKITFEVMVAEDCVTNDQWAQIWVLAQENGLGSLRNMGFGRFDIERFEKRL